MQDRTWATRSPILASVQLLRCIVSELNTGLPGIRRIQRSIQNQQKVEIKLSTGDVLKGKVRWQDPECLCLLDEADHETLIWRQSIAYLKPEA